MARHTGGWVKLHLKVHQSDIGRNFMLLGLWITLIKWANWTETKINWRGTPRTLGRGEMLTSLRELADFGEVDRKTVAKWINYLELRGSIAVEKSPPGSKKGMIVKVLNYEKYQSVDAAWSADAGREAGHEGPGSVPTYKDLKNIRTSSSGGSATKKQEARFRFAKEIEELKPIFAALFDNVLPKTIEKHIPDILIAAQGNVETVKVILEDLYQSPKVRTGEGLGGNKSSYVTAAILGRFGIGGEAS